MRECIKCNQRRGEELFPKRKQGKSNVCKKCTNIYQRSHYKNNRQSYIDKAKRNRIKSMKRNVLFLKNFCKENPCVDCGECDFIVLHFDHVRGKKYKNISQMTSGSLRALKNELKKCEVRCANCHMRKTARQFSYYAYLPK